MELTTEHTLRSNLGQTGGVHHCAPTHIHFLKGLNFTINRLGYCT